MVAPVPQQAATFSGPVWVAPGYALRQIGPEASSGLLPGLVFNADVTEREEHRDQLYITEHPIESGAAISDHAYKRPAEIQLRIGYSNATHADPTFVTQIYQDLLRFQADRTPFDLYTGKRVYTNMLLAGLIVETDVANEWALRIEANCRQIFLVNTQVYAISTDPSALASPQTALPTVDAGSKTLGSASNVNTTSLGNLIPGGASSAAVASVQTVPLAGPESSLGTSPLSSPFYGAP